MKRPSFQFYPGDWLQDASLRMVSIGARGLWMDMICLMHQGSDYGYLKVNGKVILPSNLSRMCGATLQETEGWLDELSAAGVFSIDEENCIFSRRMIRDEEIRKARAEGGFKGGNPKLKVVAKVDNKVNLQPNLQPTPSSSSSSSSSSSNLNSKATVASDAGRLDCPAERIVDAYHRLMPDNPECKVLNASRRGAIKSRWIEASRLTCEPFGYSTIEDGIAAWERFFSICATSQFLTGKATPQSGKPPFIAGIDFLLSPSGFAKCLENHYHREAA